MSDPMDRFEDIMATVEPRERRYLRWRVAPDVVDAIAGRKITDYRGLQIMGYPADVDESLTAGTIEYDTGGRVIPPGWEEALRAAGFAPDLDDEPEDSLDEQCRHAAPSHPAPVQQWAQAGADAPECPCIAERPPRARVDPRAERTASASAVDVRMNSGLADGDPEAPSWTRCGTHSGRAPGDPSSPGRG